MSDCDFCVIGMYEGDEIASIEPGWLELSKKGNHPFFLPFNETLVHASCMNAAIEAEIDPDNPSMIHICAICQVGIEIESEMVRVRWGILRSGELDEDPRVFKENYFHIHCIEEHVGVDAVSIS